MPYEKYIVRPTSKGLSLASSGLTQPFDAATWDAKNFKLMQGQIRKRNGYYLDRTLPNEQVMAIAYALLSSTGYTVIFMETDALVRKTGASETWQYINEQHTEESVSDISSGVVTGNSTDWVDATDDTAPVAGDMFIMDNELTAAQEPNSAWIEIDSVDNDTQITLVDTYEDETQTGNYTIRRKYSVPSNENWSWAIVKDNLYFTNGDINVQKWTGTGAASTLDSTDATKARYCIEYADRLVLADLFVSGSRQMYTIKWCISGDPTDWTGIGSGSADLGDTSDFITGLGKVGANLVVYKQDSVIIGNRTGAPSAPIAFTRQKKGIGTPAPYSIVHAHGTNFFIGRSDFFLMNGDTPQPIGRAIRDKFFDMTTPTELKRCYGYHNALENEVRWLTTDEDGKRWMFVYDYIYDEWMVYDHAKPMACGGKGAN